VTQHYHRHDHHHTVNIDPNALPLFEDTRMTDIDDVVNLENRIDNLELQLREMLIRMAAEGEGARELVTRYINAVREHYPNSELAHAFRMDTQTAPNAGQGGGGGAHSYVTPPPDIGPGSHARSSFRG
ncbi:hypothetical protein F4805DRAFT_410103, partial [Annulohypoxylon moriforme]